MQKTKQKSDFDRYRNLFLIGNKGLIFKVKNGKKLLQSTAFINLNTNINIDRFFSLNILYPILEALGYELSVEKKPHSFYIDSIVKLDIYKSLSALCTPSEGVPNILNTGLPAEKRQLRINEVGGAYLNAVCRRFKEQGLLSRGEFFRAAGLPSTSYEPSEDLISLEELLGIIPNAKDSLLSLTGFLSFSMGTVVANQELKKSICPDTILSKTEMISLSKAIKLLKSVVFNPVEISDFYMTYSRQSIKVRKYASRMAKHLIDYLNDYQLKAAKMFDKKGFENMKFGYEDMDIKAESAEADQISRTILNLDSLSATQSLVPSTDEDPHWSPQFDLRIRSFIKKAAVELGESHSYDAWKEYVIKNIAELAGKTPEEQIEAVKVFCGENYMLNLMPEKYYTDMYIAMLAEQEALAKERKARIKETELVRLRELYNDLSYIDMLAIDNLRRKHGNRAIGFRTEDFENDFDGLFTEILNEKKATSEDLTKKEENK